MLSPIRLNVSSRLAIFLCPFFFFNDPAPTEIYTLSLHDALPNSAPSPPSRAGCDGSARRSPPAPFRAKRSEEHTSELQSRRDIVCRLLLEKKKEFSILLRKQEIKMAAIVV